MQNLGEFIKNKRENAGLSQKKLSNICGVSDSEIMKIEKGQRKSPNWENLCKIAKALGISCYEILLEAEYITEKDINPTAKLSGLELLNENEIDSVQTFIDFLLYKSKHKRIAKEEFPNAL